MNKTKIQRINKKKTEIYERLLDKIDKLVQESEMELSELLKNAN